MAESTLSLKYSDLAGEVGQFLGWGRGATNGDQEWTRQQKAEIETCVRSGLRQFYFPPPIEGQESSYDWSFLKPYVSLGLVQGSGTISLPDDFGGFEGDINLATTTSQVSWPVQLVGEGQVVGKYSELPSATGRPLLASLRPLRATTATAGQRWQLYLWPLADQAYTLQFAYYVNANCLDTAFPYHLGGMPHTETILESCLSVAEERLDDTRGVHYAKFQERLLASISHDRKMKPQTLGYNADRSDGRRFDPSERHWQNRVTYNGTQY